MSNKVIWITGASTGIGKAIAIKFSKNGWNVAISARRLELLEKISKQNQNVFSFPLDVTNKDDCHKVFTEIKNKLGKIETTFMPYLLQLLIFCLAGLVVCCVML